MYAKYAVSISKCWCYVAIFLDSGCDGQVAPQTNAGSVVGLAVRLNLPAIAVFHSLWSITKISVPLKRTAVATVSNLSNYQVSEWRVCALCTEHLRTRHPVSISDCILSRRWRSVRAIDTPQFFLGCILAV